ncbi:MAG: hypothetical protein WC637_13880 [Victivallales bacterium]
MQNYAEPELTKSPVKKTGKKGTHADENKRRQLKNVNYACRQLIWALVNSTEFLFRH